MVLRAAGRGGGGGGGPQAGRPQPEEDFGRPVEQVAKDLGVTPEKFREAFQKVKPASRGEQPPEAQRQANRKILSKALGVSPEKLDEVMDKHRPEGRVGGPEERGGPEGAPPHNPERFIEHAMQFDADGDGKLSKDELLKFAEDMGRRRDAEGGPPGGGNRPNEGERPKRSE